MVYGQVIIFLIFLDTNLLCIQLKMGGKNFDEIRIHYGEQPSIDADALKNIITTSVKKDVCITLSKNESPGFWKNQYLIGQKQALVEEIFLGLTLTSRSDREVAKC